MALIMDIKSKEARSLNMSKIRSKNTKPEVFIRSKLHKQGFRFYVNSKLIEGHPDIYFTKKKVAIFVNGCYWHRHENCKFAYYPKSNVEFWLAKFEANKKRDALVMEMLNQSGVRILVIWECTVKKMMKDDLVCSDYIDKISNFILSNRIFFEI